MSILTSVDMIRYKFIYLVPSKSCHSHDMDIKIVRHFFQAFPICTGYKLLGAPSIYYEKKNDSVEWTD